MTVENAYKIKEFYEEPEEKIVFPQSVPLPAGCFAGRLHRIRHLRQRHVPVLAIAAHIPSSEIGSGYFQETHPQELFRECSHYCELVSSPEQIPQVLAIAMRKAVLNRGVSVVVLPGDVALKPAPEGATMHWYHAPQPVVTPALVQYGGV